MELENFEMWDAGRDAVVERGNWLKFGQNEDLTRILLGTGDKELVEASPNDSIVCSSGLPAVFYCNG